MRFLDSLKNWLRTEAAEASDVIDSTRSRVERDLGRREADLAATPAEKLDMLQTEIADDDAFGALRDKIEGRMATADAVEELDEADSAGTTAADKEEDDDNNDNSSAGEAG